MTSPGTSFADPGSSGGSASRDVQVNLNADVSGYSQSVGQAQQQTAALGASVDKLSASMSNLTKAAGKHLLGFAAADFAGMSVAVADAASLERQLSTLRATSAVTGTSMRAMKGQLDEAFSTFPVARSQLVQLAETINNLGVTAPKAVGAAVSTFTKLGAATGESSIGLASGNIQLNRQMGNTDPNQVDGYANSLLTVSKMQGVAASGVLEFAQNIAPMARAAGIGEAAVLGISAAFQKAGADGAYAANTFNKVITEIDTLKQTGSPELGKYAAFVGKGPQEFAAQSGTEQATQVFSQIGKGGPEALNFMASIGLGPRDLKAVQAVAQQGGIGQAVAQAQGASTNTENLDKGSEAAFSGLTDSLVELGNKVTMIGEAIGAPLLKPLTLFADGLGAVVGGIEKFVSALGPLPAIIGTVAGAVAAPAGLAMMGMGGIGTLALGRTMLGKQSAGRVAFSEGRQAAGLMAGGMTQEAAMLASGRVGQRITAGQDPMNPLGRAGMRYTVPYQMGISAGPRAAGGGPLGSAAGRVVGGAAGAGTWAMNWSRGIRQDSWAGHPLDKTGAPGLPFFAQVGKSSGEGFGALRETAKTGAGLVKDTARAGASMGTAATGRAASLAAAGVGIPVGVRVPVPAPVGEVAAKAGGMLGKVGGMLGSVVGNPLTMIAGMVAIPLIGSVVDAIKQGNEERKDVFAGGSGAAKYDQALDRTSSHLARFGDNVNTASYSLAKFANMPLEGIGKVSGEDINAVTTSGYAVADERLPGVLKGAVETQSKPGADQSTIKNTALSYIKSIAQENGTGPLSTDRLAKVRRDMLSVLGTGQEALVNEIVASYVDNPQAGGVESPDIGGLTSQASKAGSLGDYRTSLDAVVRGIKSSTQDSGQAGADSRLAQGLRLGATTTVENGPGIGDRQEGFRGYLGELTGMDAEEFRQKQQEVALEQGTVNQQWDSAGRLVDNRLYDSPEEAMKVNPRAFARTSRGQDVLKQRNMNEDQFVTWAQDPNSAALPPVSASGAVQNLTKAGKEMGSLAIQGIGVYAANNTKFQAAATGAESGQPGSELAAAQNLAGETARQSGGNLSQAAANLRMLSDHMGGVTDATGKLIASSAAWIDKLQQFQNLDLNPQQQYVAAREKAQIDMSAANPANKPSKETVDKGQASLESFVNIQEAEKQSNIGKIKTMKAAQVQADRAAESNTIQVTRSERDYTTQRERAQQAYGISRGRTEQQFAIQRARSALSFNIQYSRSQEEFQISQVRAEQDYHLQRSRSAEDFGISQARAAHDYSLQVFRAQEDYQIQALRSQADYQRNVNRQNADHARDLKRQALAAAQDIYDPFARIQAKATTDAGTLIYNLKQQNADIELQLKQVQELKDRGLSQDSIDVLKLADAGNAQQVRALSMSLDQNPDMVGQINDQIGQRKTSAAKLTQSPDNVAFRQQSEDYAQQMQRASEDFSTMQQRAAEDQSKTMQRMSDDFATSTQRAGEDQAKAMDRMATDFATSTARAAEDQGRSLAIMSADFELAQAQAAEDQAITLANMAQDFAISEQQAAADHAKALSDMAADYERTQRQAAEDLATSLEQYSGNFSTIMDQMVSLASGRFRQFFPQAADMIIEQANRIKQSLTPMNAVITSAFSQSGQPTVGTLGPNMGIPQHASGGISLSQHQATISEFGPEAIIPLNSHGENFMAGLIARAMVQGVTTATNALPGGNSTSNSSDNRISFAGAEITVTASDPNAMAKGLAAKAKLARLASPVRH